MAFSPPSGAYPLNAQETDYIVLTYHQIIDMLGLPLTYKIQQITGQDEYEHPVISFIVKTINGVVANLTTDEYSYVEVGFLPTHYANVWVYDAVPQIGDHVIWQDIEWEVRNSIPTVISNRTVYYRVLIRRILTDGTLQSGGEITQLGSGDP